MSFTALLDCTADRGGVHVVWLWTGRVAITGTKDNHQYVLRGGRCVYDTDVNDKKRPSIYSQIQVMQLLALANSNECKATSHGVIGRRSPSDYHLARDLANQDNNNNNSPDKRCEDEDEDNDPRGGAVCEV